MPITQLPLWAESAAASDINDAVSDAIAPTGYKEGQSRPHDEINSWRKRVREAVNALATINGDSSLAGALAEIDANSITDATFFMVHGHAMQIGDALYQRVAGDPITTNTIQAACTDGRYAYFVRSSGSAPNLNYQVDWIDLETHVHDNSLAFSLVAQGGVSANVPFKACVGGDYLVTVSPTNVICYDLTSGTPSTPTANINGIGTIVSAEFDGENIFILYDNTGVDLVVYDTAGTRLEAYSDASSNGSVDGTITTTNGGDLTLVSKSRKSHWTQADNFITELAAVVEDGSNNWTLRYWEYDAAAAVVTRPWQTGTLAGEMSGLCSDGEIIAGVIDSGGNAILSIYTTDSNQLQQSITLSVSPYTAGSGKCLYADNRLFVVSDDGTDADVQIFSLSRNRDNANAGAANDATYEVEVTRIYSGTRTGEDAGGVMTDGVDVMRWQHDLANLNEYELSHLAHASGLWRVNDPNNGDILRSTRRADRATEASR